MEFAHFVGSQCDVAEVFAEASREVKRPAMPRARHTWAVTELLNLTKSEIRTLVRAHSVDGVPGTCMREERDTAPVVELHLLAATPQAASKLRGCGAANNVVEPFRQRHGGQRRVGCEGSLDGGTSASSTSRTTSSIRATTMSTHSRFSSDRSIAAYRRASAAIVDEDNGAMQRVALHELRCVARIG